MKPPETNPSPVPRPIPLSDVELAEALDAMVNSGRIELIDAVLIAEAAERLKLRPVPLSGAINWNSGRKPN